MDSGSSNQNGILDVTFKSYAAQSTELYSMNSNVQRKPTVRKPPPIEGLSRHSSESSLAIQQSFWKFHLIKFGPSMYLSTNPSPRHLHCRNAPGYFVRLTGSAVSYTMVFEDIETGEPLVLVHKAASRRGELQYNLHKERVVVNGALVDAPLNFMDSHSLYSQDPKELENVQDKVETGNVPPPLPPRSVFQGCLRRQPIPTELIPAASLAPQINLLGTMIDGQNWNVGSIPRVRESRLNSKDLKYISKLNVYFHCHGDSMQAWKDEAPAQVKAVFRECATKSKKRLIRKINRLLRVGAAEPVQTPDLDSPYEDVKYHRQCGDGLYFDETPADDEPDHHHKLGWLTVYDDSSKYEVPGFFDLVVALTVAACHEKNC